MKLLRVWLYGLSFVLSLLLSGQAIAQVTIMPVGDSITQGVRGECSYRRSLSQALIANSCDVDFVGSRITAGAGGTANIPPIPVCAPQNTDHQAVSSYRADEILSNPQFNFTTELENKQPDIVLLHVGSNDIFQNQSVASTVDDIDAIIDRVFEQQPGATVVVADVIPWSEESITILSGFPNSSRDMLAVTAELSIAIKTLVDNRATSGDAVVLVEVKDGFENDLMAIDGVHPNPVGEAHISNKMLTALYGLGVCNSSPIDVQPPITYISIPSEEDEQLTASPTLSGTALDEGGSGINKVRIAIENPAGEWLNYGSGTFSTTFDSSIVATLSNTTTGSTSWSITTDLAPGDYRLYALALDNNENQVEESAGDGQPNRNQKVWTTRAFEVVVDTDVTSPAITSPVAGTTLNPGSMTFSWVDNGMDVEAWWLYAGNAQSGRGQYAYDRGESLPPSTSSTILTGLPGDGSTVFVTLWYKVDDIWESVITEYKADSSGEGVPKISSPADGGELSSNTETFTWTPNGAVVSEYWLYVGTDVGNFDYFNSGSLTGTSAVVSSLPTSGETVYVRLWYRADKGSWLSVDSTYKAAKILAPEISNPANGATISTSQTFNWTANGITVDEWWLYAGTAPGSANLYSSGTLGTATSDTISGLPSSSPVYVTLWFRATAGTWQSVRYRYSVE